MGDISYHQYISWARPAPSFNNTTTFHIICTSMYAYIVYHTTTQNTQERVQDKQKNSKTNSKEKRKTLNKHTRKCRLQKNAKHSNPAAYVACQTRRPCTANKTTSILVSGMHVFGFLFCLFTFTFFFVSRFFWARAPLIFHVYYNIMNRLIYK